MNPTFLSWIASFGLAIAKQAAIAATPVALAVAESAAALLPVAVKVAMSTTLSASEKSELYSDAWDAVQTDIAVCVREGGALAKEIVTLVADAAASDVKSALGIP